MKLISNQKRSKVYYDGDSDTYIKNFYPKFCNKLKFFFKLRNYPGDNFKFIHDELLKLDISVVEILSYSHYSVVTKNIHGIPLHTYLKNTENKKIILEKFILLISKLLNNGIYSGDFSYDNFIVKNDEIIVIDMEDYKKVKFFKKNNSEAIRRMYGKIDEWVIEEIKKNINI